MDPRLEHLRATAPAWFTPSTAAGPDLLGTARPRQTAWETQGLDLRLAPRWGAIQVGEASPGTHLPRRCAERHIQADQTFCLGLVRLPIGDRTDAEVWWAYLEQWLLLQSIAEQTGVWPPENALDHGEAGALQLRAVELAGELDLSDEYRRAHADHPSWITDPAVRLVDRDGRPFNGRRVCPDGCTRRARRPRPVLWRNCPHRSGIIELIMLERRRRAALAAYWKAEREQGGQCCGTMLSCPLRPAPAPRCRALNWEVQTIASGTRRRNRDLPVGSCVPKGR